MLTRRAVRHHLIRLRNARIAASRDEAWPLRLHMHPLTLAELLMDGDPHERHVIDFEGKAFMRIPIVEDVRLAQGAVEVVWP